MRVAEAFGRPTGRCAACHVEHLGGAGLMPTAQAFCADCHAKLTARVKDGRFGDAADFRRRHPEFRPTLVVEPRKADPLLTRRWTIADLQSARRVGEGLLPAFNDARCDGFAIGQPNFRGLTHLSDRRGVPEAAMAGDNTGLVFPHALHLSARGCVATLARRLHVPTKADGALDCAQCHSPDQTGERFRRVSMERSCQVRHSLVFDRLNGVDRRLPHGQPQAVVGMTLDFYKAEAVDVVRSGAGERHRPGEAAVDRAASLREAAFTNAGERARARVTAIFSPGGSCYGCHEIRRPSAARIDFDVAPVSVRDRFLPLAAFDHRAHSTAGMKCLDCHAAATGSRSSTDVLLPGIAKCRTCHAGEHAYARVASPCVTCHVFHGADAEQPLMAAHALSAAQAQVRAASTWRPQPPGGGR